MLLPQIEYDRENLVASAKSSIFKYADKVSSVLGVLTKFSWVLHRFSGQMKVVRSQRYFPGPGVSCMHPNLDFLTYHY